jgi:hypothetical protein
METAMPNSIGATDFKTKTAGFQKSQVSARHCGARSTPRVSLGLRGTNLASTLSEGWGQITLEHFLDLFIA